MITLQNYLHQYLSHCKKASPQPTPEPLLETLQFQQVNLPQAFMNSLPFLPGPCAHEILCMPTKSRVSVFFSDLWNSFDQILLFSKARYSEDSSF